MVKNKLSVFGIVIATIVATMVSFPSASAQPITQDVFLDQGTYLSPAGEFGQEKIGTVTYEATNDTFTLTSNIETAPADGGVFEGWLYDEASGYTLSLGEFTGNTLEYKQNLVFPLTYNEFLVSIEPVDDLNPTKAGTYGGAVLQDPYGQ